MDIFTGENRSTVEEHKQMMKEMSLLMDVVNLCLNSKTQLSLEKGYFLTLYLAFLNFYHSGTF